PGCRHHRRPGWPHSWQAPGSGRSDCNAHSALRSRPRGIDRRCPRGSTGSRRALEREHGAVPRAHADGVRGLLGDGRAARQGGRIRNPGPGCRVHRGPERQLFRSHGVATVRDRGASARLGYFILDGTGSPVSVEILVNVAPRETRAAIVETGVLQEIYVERTSKRGLVSNLYKGRVSRVLPGMQAAFVDIGLERTAFLHAADIAEGNADDTVVLPTVDDIRRLVSPGDDILVQVIKDPLGTKGARLTTFIALPSRYLVYMPRGEGIGVSTRIDDEGERQRLKDAISSAVPPDFSGGYILRTAAQGVPVESLREDMA